MLTLTSMMSCGPGELFTLQSTHPSWGLSNTRRPMTIATSNAYYVAYCVTVMRSVLLTVLLTV